MQKVEDGLISSMALILVPCTIVRFLKALSLYLTLVQWKYNIMIWYGPFFLKQKLVTMLESATKRVFVKNHFWGAFTWFKGESFRDKWEIPLCRMIKIITLCSPGSECVVCIVQCSLSVLIDEI